MTSLLYSTKDAWDLYLKETKGDIDAAIYWHEIPEEVQQLFLDRVSPKQQAIEVLARRNHPFSWGEVDAGTRPREDNVIKWALYQAAGDIEALLEAGLEIVQKEGVSE